jgi:hypothetical protein
MKAISLVAARRARYSLVGVWGSGFRVLGCRVQGSGFGVQGSGFRVQGSGCRRPVCNLAVLRERARAREREREDQLANLRCSW